METKRRSKTSKVDYASGIAQEIQDLEDQITESRKHYNNVAVLIKHAGSKDLETAKCAQLALCRVFVRLLSSDSMTLIRNATGNESIIVQWLDARYKEYGALLLASISRGSLNEQKQALRLILQLVKAESRDNHPAKGNMEEQLGALVELIATSDGHRELQLFFVDEYASQYKDLLSKALRYATAILKGARSPQTLDPILHMLQNLVDRKPEDLWTSSSTVKYDTRRDQSEAWLALLKKDITKQQRKLLLELIPQKIAPVMQRPERLLDFITDAFNTGGSTSILALSGLFELIKTQNLDYPQFYRKVYSQLDSFMLHSKHRSKFLRLLEIFLDSTHLPAALVASFIKRLSRLCLFAPPPAIAVIVPMVYNLLKGHPTCTFMIHRTACCEEHIFNVSTDPFSMDIEDPFETGALESSLWELYTLQSHYNPNVATICKIISEQFTKPAFNLEDFLDHSYASMLEADLSKPMKKEPVVEYLIPKTIFPSSGDSSNELLKNPLSAWNFGR